MKNCSIEKEVLYQTNGNILGRGEADIRQRAIWFVVINRIKSMNKIILIYNKNEQKNSNKVRTLTYRQNFADKKTFSNGLMTISLAYNFSARLSAFPIF